MIYDLVNIPREDVCLLNLVLFSMIECMMHAIRKDMIVFEKFEPFSFCHCLHTKKKTIFYFTTTIKCLVLIICHIMKSQTSRPIDKIFFFLTEYRLALFFLLRSDTGQTFTEGFL